MKIEYVLIVILAFAVGFLISKLRDKRNTNIIKLQIKKDLLPPPGAETKWLQGAQCYMSDGSIGKTNGDYCEQIVVL